MKTLLLEGYYYLIRVKETKGLQNVIYSAVYLGNW